MLFCLGAYARQPPYLPRVLEEAVVVTEVAQEAVTEAAAVEARGVAATEAAEMRAEVARLDGLLKAALAAKDAQVGRLCDALRQK